MNETTYDTVWDSSNDYSYSDLISFEDDNDAAAVTKKVTAYVDGDLVWGVEPDGTTPEETTEPATEEPSETETSTSSENNLYGDVNVDDDVTIADAVLLNKYLVNSATLSEQGMANADAFYDGRITSDDTLAILKLIVGTFDTLPVMPE